MQCTLYTALCTHTHTTISQMHLCTLIVMSASSKEVIYQFVRSIWRASENRTMHYASQGVNHIGSMFYHNQYGFEWSHSIAAVPLDGCTMCKCIHGVILFGLVAYFFFFILFIDKDMEKYSNELCSSTIKK